MIQHARHEHSFECCGILLGQQSRTISQKALKHEELQHDSSPPYQGGAGGGFLSSSFQSPVSRLPPSIPPCKGGKKQHHFYGNHISQQTLITRIIKATNIATEDREKNYQIDWQTLFNTVRVTRLTSDRIIGFYHSHPDGSTQPSSLDLNLAWIDHSYIILSRQPEDKYTITSWRIHHENGTFQREQLTCTAINEFSQPLTYTA